MRGFLRKDGRKGIRNVVVVTYLVECAHHVAAHIAQQFQDEDVHLIGFSGCAPNDYAELIRFIGTQAVVIYALQSMHPRFRLSAEQSVFLN